MEERLRKEAAEERQREQQEQRELEEQREAERKHLIQVSRLQQGCFEQR